MLLKLGMGSGGNEHGERKNETWQQSRELEIKSLESLSNDDGDVKRTAKNNNSARTSRFFHISLPSSHDYDMKLPNFTLCGGREHKTTTLFFFSEL